MDQVSTCRFSWPTLFSSWMERQELLLAFYQARGRACW